MGDSYDDAAKKLGQIGEALHGITDEQLLALGHAGMDIIVLRTRAGLDADRKPFVPYSQTYAAEKYHGGAGRSKMVSAVASAEAKRSRAWDRGRATIKKYGAHSAHAEKASKTFASAAKRLNAAREALKEYDTARPVDLVRTGHMVQSLIVSPGDGEVVIGFGSSREAQKAAWHNEGVDKRVNVRGHSRGRTASKAYKKAKRKKNAYRRLQGSVRPFKRHQFLSKRNWFDVRAPEEAVALTEMVGVDVLRNVEKVVNGK